MPRYRVTFADGFTTELEAICYALAIEQAHEIDDCENRPLKSIEQVADTQSEPEETGR